MFRWIGISLLVMCAFVLLQGATLFAGITNGTFDSDLSGWETTGIVDQFWPGYAKMYEGSSLSQEIEIDHGCTVLQFDLQFPLFAGSETEKFSASFDNPYKVVDGVRTYFIGDPIKFFEVATDSESDEVVIQTISTVLNPDWAGVTIRFDLTSEDTRFEAYALIDNVALVPEPATMTLGLIGVAAVGAVRRRMR